MGRQNFITLVRESFFDLFRKPGSLLAGLVLFVGLFLFSTFGGTIASRLRTNTSNIVWIVIFFLILVGVLSFIFSGMIGLLKKHGRFFKNGRIYWKSNFLIIIIIILISFIIGRIAHYGAFFIGTLLGLGVTSATVFFVFIYFVGLVAGAIFLTYASFFLVFDDLGIAASIRKSKQFVLGHYLETLSILVGLFFIGFLINKIPGIVGDVVEYILYLPYAVFILGNIILNEKRK